MTNTEPGTDFLKKIAVFRALKGLGDLLCAVPALRALRAGLPNAQICLVGLPEANFLLERFPQFLDELIIFPGWPGMPEREPQPYQIPQFLSEMHSKSFDLSIQMHGNGSVFNPVTVLFGASYIAGQYLPGNFCPDPGRFVEYDARVPEVRRCLKIIEKLGFEPLTTELEFPLTDRDYAELTTVTGFNLAEISQFVCIHPGASTPERRWAPEYFAAVGDELTGRGHTVVLTGSAGEIGLVEEVARRMRGPAICMAGKLSLGGMAALLNKARLLICNDTGISHLADALKVKSIVIFSRSDPLVWAPLDRRLHRVVITPAGEGAISPHESFRVHPGWSAVARVLVEAGELLGQADLVSIR